LHGWSREHQQSTFRVLAPHGSWFSWPARQETSPSPDWSVNHAVPSTATGKKQIQTRLESVCKEIVNGGPAKRQACLRLRPGYSPFGWEQVGQSRCSWTYQ
jgi:hypothetical protein